MNEYYVFDGVDILWKIICLFFNLVCIKIIVKASTQRIVNILHVYSRAGDVAPLVKHLPNVCESWVWSPTPQNNEKITLKCLMQLKSF